jgi:pyruvate carboxylase subunit B
MPTTVNSAKRLKITDTTFRDGHQSVAATRMRTKDMEPIAEAMGKVGFHSMEVWGGATFDVSTRFLFEDPWERARILKKLLPDTPLQMLLRGQNLVGYRHYPDDVVEAFVQHAADSGVDIFRIFDALNDERNLETATRAAKATGKHVQLAVCYSVTDEGRLGGPVFNLEYFREKARILENMGADSICLKDMAGILAPYDAFAIIEALKKDLSVPVQLHTHYTTGMASMTALKAVEAGVDILDACLAPFAMRTSQPAVESMVIALRGTPRDTELDLDRLLDLGGYLESLGDQLKPHLSGGKLAVVDPGALVHQVPGGMISNLTSQLRELEALDRLPEVLEDLPRTRRELGTPPLVTPTSQILAAQAVNNVLFGRWERITDQVKDYVYGLYGRPPLPIDPELTDRVLNGYALGSEPISGRPSDILEPELGAAKVATDGLARDIGDVLIYALYPVTGKRFLRVKYGLDPAPDDGSAAPVPAAPAPSLTGTSVSSQARTFNIYVGDRSFQVTVDPADSGSSAGSPGPSQNLGSSDNVIAQSTSQPKPVPAAGHSPPSQIGSVAINGTPVSAPMPGVVVRYLVEEGQRVKTGESVVVLEAMKMENALPAPVDGVVQRLCFASGAKVGRGDALAIITAV